jgi:hypothetical protein
MWRQIVMAWALQVAPEVWVRAPAEVSIGEVVVVTLIVPISSEGRVDFPRGPETHAGVELRDPVVVQMVRADGSSRAEATYHLMFWETGPQVMRFAAVRLDDGRSVRQLEVAPQEVRVRSVLPEDTTARVPRPARPPVPIAGIPWRILGLFGSGLLVVAGLVRWRLRRRRLVRRQTIAPAQLARLAFAHLRTRDLAAAGEGGSLVVAARGIVRSYLAQRFPQGVPPAVEVRVLERVDAVAFAGARIDAAEAKRLVAELEQLIERCEALG